MAAVQPAAGTTWHARHQRVTPRPLSPTRRQTLHRDRALKHNLFRIAFEGSTHYAREGPKMARGLREVFPWVKLIASMREPIR